MVLRQKMTEDLLSNLLTWSWVYGSSYGSKSQAFVLQPPQVGCSNRKRKATERLVWVVGLLLWAGLTQSFKSCEWGLEWARLPKYEFWWQKAMGLFLFWVCFNYEQNPATGRRYGCPFPVSIRVGSNLVGFSFIFCTIFVFSYGLCYLACWVSHSHPTT